MSDTSAISPLNSPTNSAQMQAQRQAIQAAERRKAMQPAEEAKAQVLSAERLASSFDNLASYCQEHGSYQGRLTHEFAAQVRANAKRFAEEFLASERRRLVEIERVLGDLVG